MNKGKCVFCKRTITNYGNYAEPVKNGRCCDLCNELVVIPARLMLILQNKKLKK